MTRRANLLGRPSEEPALHERFGGFLLETSETERGGESRDGPQREGREDEEEPEQDRRLRFRREHPNPAGREDDAFGREAAEDAAQGHEEKDAECRERQGGRLQLDPREERRGHGPARDRGGDRD